MADREQTFQEALKRLREPSERKKLLERRDNYVQVEFGYDCTVVLPRKNFILLCEALEGAELYKAPYGEEPQILPINDRIKSSFMSEKEYLDIKMAELLEVSVKEVRNGELAPEE